MSPNMQLPPFPTFPIIANCEYRTTVQLKNEFIQTFKYELDLCQFIIEIEKELAKFILPIDYSIIIHQNGKPIYEPYLNSYLEIPKHLDYIVRAFIYFNCNQTVFQLEINPFDKILRIKQQIFSSQNINQEFSLIYNNKKLNDEYQFISYLIPNYSEIIIKFSNRITFFVKYQNTVIHQYSIQPNEKVGVVKSKLKYVFKIPENQRLELIYQQTYLNNDELKLSYLQIKDDCEIEVTIGKIYKLILEDDASQQKYTCQVKQAALVSSLDNYGPFKDYNVSYYFNDKELDKNKHFEQIQNNNDINVNIKFKKKKKLITVFFQDEMKQKIQMEVSITDPIKLALQIINKANDPITIIYNDKKISIENTYAQEAIKNGSIIIYYLNQFQIKYSIAPNPQEYSLQITQQIDGAQLLNMISRNQKGLSQTFKLMLNNSEFPANQMVDPFENQCFRVVPTFEIQFRFLNDGKIYKEVFSIEDSILNARQRFSQKFNIPLNQLFILFMDLAIKDEYLIQQYQKKDLWICETIRVKFQQRNGSLLTLKYYNKNLQIKEILKDLLKSFSQQACKCLFNNQLVNESNMLKEITNQSEIVLIVDFLQDLQLIDKLKIQQEITVQFYPKEIVASIFSRYLRGNFFFYHNNQLIDTSMNFEDNHIQNKSQIYFEEFYNYTLESLKDNSQIQFQAPKFTKIKDAISPQIKDKYQEQFSIFYNNHQINIEKTFFEENIRDESKIQIIFNNSLIVIVRDQDHLKKFTAPSNQTIGELIKKLEGNPKKKLYSAINQNLLEDQTKLSTLSNNNNVVELIYQEDFNNQNTGYLPSEPIQMLGNDIQIIIKNMQNDDKSFEIVRLNQKIADFINQFKLKNSLSNITIFYGGEIVDINKTFEEINVTTNSEFEIL
ncbi:unnamed protein product [Paramecium sonneborni]|uniref:Ubiquitin-like domain-containing protein n=1 Tax=Paramecium sonneborni TaxID=65129 RepID=A0A8S1R9B9_9CILI|nr:unnamed protein product [Paramecium sonneborni]